MNPGSSLARSLRHACRALPLFFCFLAALSVRAELVSLHVAHRNGAADGHLRVQLGTSTLDLTGSSDSGESALTLYPDEPLLIQLSGTGVGEFEITFTPPANFSTVIHGVRMPVYRSVASSPRLLEETLLVSLVRRDAIAPHDRPLGHAASIAWQPPKMIGSYVPYLDFNVGRASNGESLPPLRVPLLPRHVPDEPLPVDLPDSTHAAISGGLKITIPQVETQLVLDPAKAGDFFLTFHRPGDAGAFATYHFQFITWSYLPKMLQEVRVSRRHASSPAGDVYQTTLKGYYTAGGIHYFPGMNTWNITDWHRTGHAPIRYISGVRTLLPGESGGFNQWYNAGTYQDTIEVRAGNAGAALVDHVAYSYRQYTQTGEDANGPSQTVIAPLEIAKAADPQNITQLFQDPRAYTISGTKFPDGRNTFVDDSFGETKYYDTWLARSPGFNPNAGWGYHITPNDCAVTTVNYNPSASLLLYRLPSSIVRRVGSTTVAKSDIVHTRSDDIITSQRTDFASAAVPLVSSVKWYRPDAATPALRNRPHSIQHASGAKQSFAYLVDGTDLTVITLSGATRDGQSVSAVPYGTGAPLPVDPLHLIPYRSTRTIEFYQRGFLTRREVAVYLGGADTSPSFSTGEPIGLETFAYTPDGRLQTHSVRGVPVYTATWQGSRKVSETDETGLATTFYYDAADRIIAQQRASAGGVPPQARSFAYDASHRVLFSRVGPIDGNGQPSGDQIVTEYYYDLAGRLREQKSPGGATDGSTPPGIILTRFEYPNGGRDLTETYPDGQRVVLRHPDGRVTSVTGSAVTASESFAYDLTASGQLRTTTTRGGLRTHSTVADWLGRTVEERSTGPIESDGIARPLVTTHHPNAAGLLFRTSSERISGGSAQPIAADRIIRFDAFGLPEAVGLDVSRDAKLEEVSDDRLTTTDTRFFIDSNQAWWLQTRTLKFHTPNSTSFHVGLTRTRLTGFATGQTAYVEHYDFFNNVTVESVSVDRIQQTSTRTRIAPDSTRHLTRTAGGVIISEQRLSDSLAAEQAATFTYDEYGRLTRAVSPRGVTTRHEYFPGTFQRRFTFHGRNEQGQEIRHAWFGYDARGRIASVTDARNVTTFTRHLPNGLVELREGDGTYPTRFTYDALGQLLTLSTYRAGVGGPSDTTTWAYDLYTGWPTRRTDAANRSIRFTYDLTSTHRVVTRHSPRPGLSTTYRYPASTGDLESIDYSDATPDVTYTYTRTGKIESVRDATGLRDYIHDRERLSAERFGAWHGDLVLTYLPDDTTVPDPGANRVPGRHAGFALGYVPIVNGVPQTQDMAREMKSALRYDDFGRIKDLIVSHANQTSADFVYTYEPNSDFWRSRTSGAFRHERTPAPHRDALKVAATTWNGSLLAEHEYRHLDSGDLTSTTQSGAIYADYGGSGGATAFTYGYNARGELIHATGKLGSTDGPPLPGRDYEFDYDTAGNRRETRIDGTPSSYLGGVSLPGGNALNQSWRRDTVRGRLSGTKNPDADVQIAGATVQQNQTSRYWDAVLDSWGRFAEVNVRSFRFGQEQSRNTWTLVRPATETFEYDEEGNLTADSLWRYTYDAENRLIRIATRSPAEWSMLGWHTPPPSRELTFKYDHLGRRVEKISRREGETLFQRRFLYAGWNLIAEFELANGTPQMRRTYAWGLDVSGSLDATAGIGALVLQTLHQGGTRTHYHVVNDGHGNVAALLDLQGNASATYEYDPYGRPLRAEGPTSGELLGQADQAGDNPFRYSSKYQDRETGLYDYGLRYYDPSLGRFLNRDPLGEAGGTNLYAFVGNNPVNRWDYLGLEEQRFRPPYPNWGPTPDVSTSFTLDAPGATTLTPLPGAFGTDAHNSEMLTKARRDVVQQRITVLDLPLLPAEYTIALQEYEDFQRQVQENYEGFRLFIDVALIIPGSIRILGAKIAGLLRKAKAAGSDRVIIYRVDDITFPPRITADGKIPVVTTRAGGERALFINIDQPARAAEFAMVNRGGKATVTAVEADPLVLERLRATAVVDTSRAASLNPKAPLRVDIKKAPDQFGLRTPEQIQMLRESLIPGTARVIDPSTLVKNQK